ncbi:Nuclear receptor subfamily 5 group A member 2-like protein [Aphelenchoides bicaudatus]|nr:Nuclear receptor subfamily 5 group A member 2-like protein [Aphelenchoides bicaudatus]
MTTFFKTEPTCSSPTSSCVSTASSNDSPFAWQSNQQMQAQQQRCPICGDQAWNKHFNILCCNACAAFFRRTIGNKKAYLCLKGKNCTLTGSRPTCKFCRFQQCVLNGLNIAVATLRIPVDKREFHLTKPPLRQLIIHRKATFVNRFHATVNVYGGRYDSIHIGKKMPTFSDTICAVHSEYAVLMEYLHSSGFVEFGLSNEDMIELAANLFYSWMCFNTVTNTAKNGGYVTNYLYFVDESHLPATEEAIEWFHRTCTEIRDPYVPSRTAYQLSQVVLNAAAKLHHARLDEAESATMCQIITLKIAARMFPANQRLQAEMNQLFENLKQHYSENFDDFATRLGNLILLTNEIEVIF